MNIVKPEFSGHTQDRSEAHIRFAKNMRGKLQVLGSLTVVSAECEVHLKQVSLQLFKCKEYSLPQVP